jgi:mRNA interferase RelE/StbE
MEIVYKSRFFKDLQKLPVKVQLRVKAVLDALHKADNLESSCVDFTRMEGRKDGQQYYRIRVGTYRIGIEYVRPDLIVIMIAARGSVYKSFPPK